jgi:hypothetical protein
VLAILVVSSSSASAQTLFEALFGSAPATGHGHDVGRAPLQFEPPVTERPAARATYRTVCVRLCDGYYFPIRYGVTRASFPDDAVACETRCPRQSQLFYLPATGEIEDAVAVDGITRYRSLANAFRYRKALVDGCSCRPEPWSEEAARRHALYADAAGSPAVATSAKSAEVSEPSEPSTSEPRRELAAPHPAVARRPAVPRQTVAARPTETGVVVARGLFGSADAKHLPVTPAKGLFGGL